MSFADRRRTIVLTDIEADVLRGLLDKIEDDNKRHSAPNAEPKLRTRVLREIRRKLT